MDPYWTYSDAHNAANVFSITELGKQAAYGVRWICRCSGCQEEFTRTGLRPAIAIDGYCDSCQGSIWQYGAV